MKSILSISGLIISLLFFNSCNNDKQQEISKEKFNSLVDNFKNLSDENTVWTYYYWYNDNVSKEGITKDLESMKKAGIGTVFIGNINWQGKDGNVPILSEEWWDAMVHAVNEGQRLGIDIGVFNSPGWSQSGGPWIEPEMAMRYLTYSETKVEGGNTIKLKLKRPKKEFQDVRTLAFKTPESEKNDLRNLIKTVNSNLADIILQRLFDNNENTTIYINTLESPVVELEFQVKKPMTARSLIVKHSTKLKCNIELYDISNGKNKLIISSLFDRSLLYINGGPNVGPIVYGELAIAVPETKSDRFKLVFKDFSSYDVYSKGVSKIGISEINISEAPVLDHFIEKQLGKMHPTDKVRWDSYIWKEQNEINDKSLVVNTVIDISDKVDSGGNLVWNAPAGEWTIIRIGMAPTGAKNLPTSPRGKGFEVDKMSKKLIKYHFEKFIGELIRRIPDESKPAFKYVIMDSYETGSQNWTDGYEVRFKDKYGYDPVKYLPVLTGRIVGSVEESERFLWDLRRSVADDIAYEYVDGLREIAHKYNLQTWLEPYGHWGFPGEFMLYGSRSDMVSGEFWNEGTLGNIECKAASSISHVYGMGKTFAEAFTAMKYPYLRHPAVLKKRGDWAFTEGINHFVLHVFIHQPDDDHYPGIDAWFSTEFNRHNTWFDQVNYYLDYIRRTQYLLQQGKYVADVCYFIGENTPVMIGREYPELPEGYSFDYINADVILNRLIVKNGLLTLPDGMSYKVMVLPESITMRPKVLAKIEELVKRGGVILGEKPEKSPSLQNYPQCDDQVNEIASRLWGGISKNEKTINKYGNGLVFSGYNLETVLKTVYVEKDVDINADVPVLWTHRKMPGMDIYFLTNQSNERISITPSFRVDGMKPQLWNAVTGEIRKFEEFSVKNGRTTVPIQLEAQQSWLIVFTNNTDENIKPALSSNFPVFKKVTRIGGPFTVDFINKKIGPAKKQYFDSLSDWTMLDDEKIKYYSGSAVYQTTFNIDKKHINGELYINLGKVEVMAEVKINGNIAGGVWDFPYRLNITKLVKQGGNKLEVKVVNLWRNRLIRDKSLPVNERFTWTLEKHDEIKSTEKLRPSGLLGPVTIETLR
jgi:hypothetical protein